MRGQIADSAHDFTCMTGFPPLQLHTSSNYSGRVGILSANGFYVNACLISSGQRVSAKRVSAER